MLRQNLEYFRDIEHSCLSVNIYSLRARCTTLNAMNTVNKVWSLLSRSLHSHNLKCISGTLVTEFHRSRLLFSVNT